MAYTPATLDCMIPRTGSGPALWIYSAAEDARGAVIEVDDYFSDGASRGLVAGDIMIVIADLDGTIGCTVHYVESTTSILAATLA